MKKLLLAGIVGTAITTAGLASAADFPPGFTPPYTPSQPPIVTYYSWTGFYIGGNVGGAFSNGTITDNLTGTGSSVNHSKVLGGGQIGVNYQTSWLVWGAEAEFDWTSLNVTSSKFVSPVNGNTLQASANTQWITTLAARLGVAADRWLFYGKGGGAWVKNNATVTDWTTNTSVSASSINGGWLAGGGVEFAFTPDWTARIEYDYLGLKSWTASSPFLGGDAFNVNHNMQILTGGVTCKFNWGSPVVAKY